MLSIFFLSSPSLIGYTIKIVFYSFNWSTHVAIYMSYCLVLASIIFFNFFNGLSSSKQHNSDQGTYWNINSSEARSCNCWLWVGMIIGSISYRKKLCLCVCFGSFISTFWCSCIGPQEVLWACFASKLCTRSSQSNLNMHTDTFD
jgi:hypothetical protein